MEPFQPITTALANVLARFEDFRARGTYYAAHCPGPMHRRGDRRRSLSISLGYDSRVLLKCHTGCATEDIVKAVGLQMSDLFERSAEGHPLSRFRVIGPNGKVEATHVREDAPDGKRMHWERNGRRSLGDASLTGMPLYRLPELLAAPAGARVVVVEGEKKADALAERGVLAVGTVTGGGRKCPSDDALRPLLGREVVLWPDNDEPGREHMRLIAERLRALARG